MTTADIIACIVFVVLMTPFMIMWLITIDRGEKFW